MDELPRNFWYRLFEILPGALSWTILIVPIVASFWHPRAVAVFIVVYVLLWFLRSLKSSAFLLHAYFKSRRFEKINWGRLLHFFSENPPQPHTKMEKETAERVQQLREKGQFKKWNGVYHVVIMPTYKEEKEILESSIEMIQQSDFPLKQIIFVLATEERDRMRAQANAAYLERRFSGVFGQFHHIMHPANISGELQAKGANITHACKKIAAILEDQGIDFSNVLVTTLDADNRPHPTFFANLTYHYLMQFDRAKKSYQPLAYFYNNIWDVPFANRIVALAGTFWYLSESGEHRMFTSSVYSLSLDALAAMDFWSRQTIVEDLHQYWRAYFHFKGDFEVVSLFAPVYQDALQNKTYFTSLIGQYEQLRRWGWGASEIAYVIMKIKREWRNVPLLKTLGRLIYMWFLQLAWATAPVIMLFNISIPIVLNPEFGRSLFAFNLGQAMGVIFSIMIIGIIISIMIITLSLPRPAGRGKLWRFFTIILQWFLLPLVTIIYGGLTALDAQTRLMLNKRLGFVVTEKVRK